MTIWLYGIGNTYAGAYLVQLRFMCWCIASFVRMDTLHGCCNLPNGELMKCKQILYTLHMVMAWRQQGINVLNVDRSRPRFHLTHSGRVTHPGVSTLNVIVSDNGLSPGRPKTIIITNTGIFLVWPLGTNANVMWIKIDQFAFTKMHLKMSCAKWRPFCLGHNMLLDVIQQK